MIVQDEWTIQKYIADQQAHLATGFGKPTSKDEIQKS
jgi:hypothetical protein